MLNYSLLREKLNFNEIPGWSAQKAMSPPYRQELVDNSSYSFQSPKIAAVLILIYQKSGKLYFPLIHRNTYPGVHSNQIGFPGGKIEKDETLDKTAIRECYEEIYASTNNIEILGELTELFIPPSNFLVYPFIGLYNDIPNFKPCDKEVKSIIPLHLESFLKDPKKTTLNITLSKKTYPVPAFELPNDMKVWGATAMILNEFRTFVINSLNLET